MKIPLAPPKLSGLLADVADVPALLARRIGPEVEGRYVHWDKLRHLPPPGIDSEQWWLAIKLARLARATSLPLGQKDGSAFTLGLTDSMLRKLHFLDREAAGLILGVDQDDGDSIRRKHLERSLIEEAMTSSQLEGASTTRRIAKQMLASGRAPRDRSEQMIFNNHATMQSLAGARDRPLTPGMILDIHRRLMRDAIDDPRDAGRWRTAQDDLAVFDRVDPSRILHVPPPAVELPERMQALCDFANASDPPDTFLHPIARAIVVHFMIGYDHPFCDGNGRTARALFYWSMLRSGYWLTEFVSISSVLKQAPDAYARAYLYTETDDGDLGYFIAHQLDVLLKAVDGLRGHIARKAAERRRAETLLKPASKLGGSLNHRQRMLLMHALKHADERFTIAGHRMEHQVSYATARADLLGLQGHGLLTQARQGKAMVFVPVVDLATRLGT